MQITAKFASTCPNCGKAIAVGTKIEWQKGSRGRHVTCPTGAASPLAARKSVAPDVHDAPYVAYGRAEPCKRVDLADATGETRRYAKPAQLREGALAPMEVVEPVYVVVAQSAYYQNQEDNEDMGDMQGAGWQITLYLRTATAEECEKDATERFGRTVPAIFTALRGLVARGEKIAAQALVAAGGGDDYATAHVWHLAAELGLDAERTMVWKPALDSDDRHSFVAAIALPDGRPAWISYTYIYDWDQPYVLRAPREIVEQAEVAEALVAAFVALKYRRAA